MLTIKAKKRDEKNEDLRNAGMVPAVLYGPETDPLKICVEDKAFRKAYQEAGESSILKLKVEGDKKEHIVLIKDYQIHPVTDQLYHIDFYQPIMSEKVEATVPVVFEGEAPVVKEKDGVLIKNISELQVSALPKELPSEIKINVGGLETFGDHITVEDISLGEGVEIKREKGDVIVSVSSPKTEEELKEEMGRTEEEELFIGEEELIEEEPLEEGEEEEKPEEEQEEIEI